jgi:uncharacterized protein YceK
MKQVALALAILGLLVGCASVSVNSDTTTETTDYANSFAKGKEARAWMATGTNHMFEASDEVCKKTIEELYALGAVEVRVTDGDKLTDESKGETAATLMAKLPSDPAKRKALFDYEAQSTEDADKDQKRDYVEVVFD